MELSKSKKTYIASVIIFILAVVSYYSNSGEKPVPYQKCSGVVWTTQYHITYQSEKLFDDSILSHFFDFAIDFC